MIRGVPPVSIHAVPCCVFAGVHQCTLRFGLVNEDPDTSGRARTSLEPLSDGSSSGPVSYRDLLSL